MGEEKARAKKQKESEKAEMRDRLIEMIQNAVGGCARHWAEVIADHLLANGVIVPKVKGGDSLYYISGVGKIVENKVYYVGEYSRALCYTADGKPLLDNVFLDADANDSYYFTKEEAEKALAERSGE